MANLLAAQGSPMTEEQASYLQRELFGGMGSLNDFSFDERLGGEKAGLANQELKAKLDDLFTAFKAARP